MGLLLDHSRGHSGRHGLGRRQREAVGSAWEALLQFLREGMVGWDEPSEDGLVWVPSMG